MSTSVLRQGRRALGGLLRQLEASSSATVSSSSATQRTGVFVTFVDVPVSVVSSATRRETSRCYAGSLPGDLDRAAGKARFPASSRKAVSEPTTSTSVKEEIVDEETRRLHKEQQDVVSGFMFPWERRQMQGGSELNTWEKYYWGIFVLAIAVFLFNRAGSWTNTEEELEKAVAEKRRKEEIERLQVERARLIMAGGSVLVGDDDEDPFEDMSPEAIEKFVMEQTGGSKKDPFAGLSPEEIDEYVKKHDL